MSAPRYRCDGCGNLTRFDVTISQKTKAFHHYSVGGDLVVEDEEVLVHNVDEVVCRWCGHGRSVVEITGDELEEPDVPLEGAVSEPPADILRRLRPIPTYTDHPATTPHDVVGVAPAGAACRIEVVEAAAPVLLLFLSAACLGCRDLWEGLPELQAGLAGAARLVVVTRSPGEESPEAITALAGHAAERSIDVVMSSDAFRDYRVGGPPFLAVAAADGVRTESVAWGLEQTLQTALDVLPTG